jgi:hypothetical protein
MALVEVIGVPVNDVQVHGDFLSDQTADVRNDIGVESLVRRTQLRGVNDGIWQDLEQCGLSKLRWEALDGIVDQLAAHLEESSHVVVGIVYGML